MVYGGHKSNFDGHAKRSVSNLMVFPVVYKPQVQFVHFVLFRLACSFLPNLVVSVHANLSSAANSVCWRIFRGGLCQQHVCLGRGG